MPHPRALDASSTLAATRDVAERVVERYSPRAIALDGERPLRDHMEDVLAALEVALDNGPGGAPTHAPPPRPPDRIELLRALRAEALRSWTDDPTELFALMRALESVEERMLEARGTAVMDDALTPFSRALLREVSHMLRSPLGSIVMLTDMLRDGTLGPLTEAQERQVGIIHRAALSITCTTSDILALVDGRERIDRKAPFSIAEVLETVCDILAPVAESRGRSVAMSVEADPDRSGSAVALREILLGLGLRSALDGRQGDLRLSAAEEDGDVVRFVVESRGNGESPLHGSTTERPEIFRVDSETGEFTISADGLGVAAVREILGMLGSELEHDEEAGAESRLAFGLTLPRQ